MQVLAVPVCVAVLTQCAAPDLASLLFPCSYGGNLCGVCVRKANGRQTALKSNNQCR